MSFKKIIQIEFIKLQRPANFVLLGLMLLLYIGISVVSFYYYRTELSIDDPSSFLLRSTFKKLIQFESGMIAFFVAIFIIMNVGKEYTDGTLRKNIIDGYTREHFFSGKLFLLLICVLFVFLFGKITMLVGGFAIGHFRETLDFFTPSVLINSFINQLSSGIFALFLIFLSRNITISILGYILWPTIEAIIYYAIVFSANDFDIRPYLPIGSMNYVLIEREIILTSSIIIATLYLFLMLLTSYLLLLKRDIK